MGAESAPVRRRLTIVNRLGLHARAAARFVAVAAEYQASVHVELDGRRVNGKSIMGLMMLAAGRGTELLVEAEGEDAPEALDALEALVADRFGEDV
ncbi:HPr family phosphocarrier protein [Spiribacter halobius]|uniref:HPr family phosphocarrier protein n=1 Tax=Sediminicurvatus halobius TaxID=2182432 RepID=A0A2U2N7Z4_9GAMM|nr:HPr family phosphocarrier protein [Spiribacter halobius]PWG65212.1 HPr family phosphocarrier protein [Spiribacter halobius]UEX78833.1 HPr family phosphocarrier protein [Spiribacter halobius]